MSVLISKDCKRAEKQHRAVRWERRMTSIGETRLACLPLIARRFSMWHQCDWCDKCDLWIALLIGLTVSRGSVISIVNRSKLLWIMMSPLISEDCKRAEKQHRAVRWERRMTSIGETWLACLPLIARRFSMWRQCDWCDLWIALLIGLTIPWFCNNSKL